MSGLLFASLSFDPVHDFTPVSLVGTYPNLIVVPNSSPFAKLEDFIAFAKANPGKISWASPGVGSVPHLAGELFKRMAGIDITHVPYRGVAAGAMTDLIAGRLDAMFNTTGSLLRPVQGKQVRCLAVTSAKRFPIAPEFPTVAEVRRAGLRGCVVVCALRARQHAAGHRQKDECQQRRDARRTGDQGQNTRPLGISAAGSTPEALAAMNASDVARWEPIIKAENIRGE